MNLSSPTRPHRRYNPLSRRWLLVSPQRTARPWQGQTTKPTPPERIHYDPACYLCPGNPRAGGHQTPRYTGVYAFDNDYPALLPPEASQQTKAVIPSEAEEPPYFGERSENNPSNPNSLLISEAEVGRCRVVCFDPDHSLTLSQMPLPSIENVVRCWQDETATLGAEPHIHYVTIFENRGAMMGSSNPHPHCQIWATGHIPDEPAAEAAAQLEYFNTHQRTLLADYLQQELAAAASSDQGRIIAQNETFVALVPYWAVWPFETLILPRTPVTSFTTLTPAQASGLAAILKHVTTIYDHLFDISFPYTMGFHQQPTDGATHPEWTFHAHFYPPLLRSAEIRKFMVGFEMLGMPQRDITPEKAAEMLRAASDKADAQSAEESTPTS